MVTRSWLIVVLVIVQSIVAGFSGIEARVASYSPPLTVGSQGSHVIEGVPYVAQTEVNYCPYACETMVLNYMGLNTSINELLFYSGAGYRQVYRSDQRLPHVDLWGRFGFMQSLFGVTEQEWMAQDHNLSDEERWAQFYTRVKKNITNDVPVITMVDPFALPSLRDQFKCSDFIWKAMFPPGHHVIVVVGYNDTNQSICYNDPNAGYYGDGRLGTYAWMPLSVFRQAHENVGVYFVITYTQTGAPLSKHDAFDEAFQSNIENLTGGSSSQGWYSGINASEQMKIDYSEGANQSQETGSLYKAYGGTGLNYTVDLVIHWLLTHLDPEHPNIYDMIVAGKQNPFGELAAAKKHVAQYIATCMIYPSLCKNQSDLLSSESDHWYNLSASYDIFMRKGLFLSNLRATHLMNSMEQLMSDIIPIEQALINQL
ncbi:MAG TPA: C39 family peptidase [Candidatus Thermoplasmatota archaeon]|nr:C39 family peptidase [Candidatus Thermoplasmatota archaeon]